LTNKNSSEII